MLYNSSLILFIWLMGPLLSHIQPQEVDPTPEPLRVAILSPQSGQALQGSVPIIVNSAVNGFQSAELSFSYSQDATQTWFVIAEGKEPMKNGDWLQWDTTTITDGNYTLQLVVYLDDGSQINTTVFDLRVRNYTPIETSTPVPTSTSITGESFQPSEALISTATLIPYTVTPLPPNPAQVSREDIFASLGKGALVTVGFFICFGLYQIFRSLTRGKGA